MAQTIKHVKNSSVPDGSDTNQVQPSDWNANHAITGTVDYSELSGKPATFPPTLPIAQANVTNLVADLALKAPLASPALTGVPTVPTASAGTNTTQAASTAFATAADVLKADLASPTFTGDPKAPTPAVGDNDTSVATTAFVTAAVTAKPGGGDRNLLHNPYGQISQRGAGNPINTADGNYGCDRWYNLADSVSSLFGFSSHQNFDATTPTSLRIENNSGASVRYGMAQAMESVDSRPLRGKQVTLSGKYISGASLRYAILGHTATEDVVPTELVLNWASASFTAGGFFVSALTVLGTAGPIAGSGSMVEMTPLTVTVPTTINNLIVFVWAEPIAHGSSIFLNAQLELGSVATAREYRPIAEEMEICLRYYERQNYTAVNDGVCAGGMFATNLCTGVIHYKPKRVKPTISATAPSHFHAAASAGTFVGSAVSFSSGINASSFNLTITGANAGQGAVIRSNNATAAIIIEADM